MTDDDLTGKVAELLSEPRPRPPGRPKDGRFSASPLGRAQAMLGLAGNLVAEADYVGALADWEERHERLRVLREELSADEVVGARRDMLAAEVEGLRLRGRCRWQHTGRVHLELAAAQRRAAAIIDHCKERQAEIATAGLGRADLVWNQMAARDRIDAETRRVLRLHAGTAAISVAQLYAASAQQN